MPLSIRYLRTYWSSLECLQSVVLNLSDYHTAQYGTYVSPCQVTGLEAFDMKGDRAYQMLAVPKWYGTVMILKK
jgi:hypothetical protein